jgi:hypothetical protein
MGKSNYFIETQPKFIHFDYLLILTVPRPDAHDSILSVSSLHYKLPNYALSNYFLRAQPYCTSN